MDSALLPPMVSAASRRTPLDLKKAVQRAIDSNWQIRMSRLDLQNAEIDYDSAFARMYLPNITLSLDGISFEKTLGQYPGDAADASTRADYGNGYPPGTGVTLSVGEFSLFNGWSDWAAFEQAKVDIAFAREDYEEKVRTLKIDVITRFFTYKTAQDRLDASRSSLVFAKSIRDLVASKKAAGVSDGDVEADLRSSESDVVQAEKDVQEKEREMMFALWSLNQILGEPLGTPNLVEDQIRFSPLRLDAEQAFKIYLQYSIEEKSSRSDLRSNEISLAQAERSRIPVPSVNFSGIQFGYHDTFFGGANDPVSPTSGGPNWQISASVSFSIPIWDENGFLNGRTIEKARNNLEKAKLARLDSLVQGRTSIYQDVLSIKQLEKAIRLNEDQAKAAREVQNNRFKQLSEEAVSRLELRDAIRDAREAEMQLLESKLSHLTAKLNLAKRIGLASLPGDPFE